MGEGLGKFVGTNFIVYNTLNSSLPYNFVLSVVIDKYNNKWSCTLDGLAVHREGGVITNLKEKLSNEIPASF